MPLCISELKVVVRTDFDGRSFPVYQGNGLPKPIDCTVIESTVNYSISLAWKHNNNSVLKFSSGMQPGIYQVKEKKSQRLYINKPALSDGGVYSCEFSIENVTVWPKSFTLIVGMLVCCLFSCMTVLCIKSESEWPTMDWLICLSNDNLLFEIHMKIRKLGCR